MEEVDRRRRCHDGAWRNGIFCIRGGRWPFCCCRGIVDVALPVLAAYSTTSGSTPWLRCRANEGRDVVLIYSRFYYQLRITDTAEHVQSVLFGLSRDTEEFWKSLPACEVKHILTVTPIPRSKLKKALSSAQWRLQVAGSPHMIPRSETIHFVKQIHFEMLFLCACGVENCSCVWLSGGFETS